MIVYEIYLCYLLDISKKVLDNYDFVIVLRRNLQQMHNTILFPYKFFFKKKVCHNDNMNF